MGSKAAMTVAARLTQAATSFALEAFGPIESNTSAAQPGSNTRRRLVLHAVAQWPAVHMRCVAGTAGTAASFLQCHDRCIIDQLGKNKQIDSSSESSSPSCAEQQQQQQEHPCKQAKTKQRTKQDKQTRRRRHCIIWLSGLLPSRAALNSLLPSRTAGHT